jgi:hypothetical protein
MTHRLYALILPLVASAASAQRPANSPVAPISLSANPSRVCVDDRGNRNPNFDIVVRNGTGRSVTINEIKAKSFNSDGYLIEQRILWQDALSLLGDQRKIAPGATGLVFNPFTFTAPNRAARIEYQLSFDELSSPSTLSVRPQFCLQKARLILPLKGRVLVYDGYDFLSHHRRQSYQEKSDLKAFGIVDNTFRFAIDLVPIDAHGQLFRGSGSSIEDWYGWSVPVRATAGGVIAAVRDDMPDNALGSEDYPKRKLSEDEMNADGNYILIDHGNGEVSSFSHLKRGSARVRKGQRVKPGDVVAVTGNSGATPIPHLHYELRTGWGVRGVRSWPPYFNDLQVLGLRSTSQPVAINTGDVVIAN